jgi:hypothetical protein
MQIISLRRLLLRLMTNIKKEGADRGLESKI